MAIHIGRRELIAALGSAAAWPLAARAQQAAMPAVGFLGFGSPASSTGLVASFRQGLAEAGCPRGITPLIHAQSSLPRKQRQLVVGVKRCILKPGLSGKSYSNLNNIRVRSFILTGAPLTLTAAGRR